MPSGVCGSSPRGLAAAAIAASCGRAPRPPRMPLPSPCSREDAANRRLPSIAPGRIPPTCMQLWTPQPGCTIPPRCPRFCPAGLAARLGPHPCSRPLSFAGHELQAQSPGACPLARSWCGSRARCQAPPPAPPPVAPLMHPQAPTPARFPSAAYLPQRPRHRGWHHWRHRPRHRRQPGPQRSNLCRPCPARLLPPPRG